MKKVVKKHYKIVIGLIIGILISATVVYAAQTVLMGNEISYDNGTSHGTSNNVQGAIDDLYDKVSSHIDTTNLPNIIVAYAYSESEDNKCITGDEETCKVTYCYTDKEKSSCNVGDIILYRVNDNETVRFHVMHDDGEKLTLQSQKNTVSKIAWYSTGNEKIENTTCIGCDNSKGPETVLTALETATENWTNVNTFDYSIGDDKSTLGYSGCDGNNKWIANPYSLERKNVKARMITMQEAIIFGCNIEGNGFCPIWMKNYLQDSISFNGTVNSNDNSYWTMSTASWGNLIIAFRILASGTNSYFPNIKVGARAVVEINK